MSESTADPGAATPDLRWAIFLTRSAGDPPLPETPGTEGAAVYELDLGQIADDEDFDRMVARVFAVPDRFAGIDAILDVLSDLEWLPSPTGYLLVLRNVPALRARNPTLFGHVVRILPGLCDRWANPWNKGGGGWIPYRVVLEVDPPAGDQALALIEEEYREFRASPWMRAGEFVETPVLESDGPAWRQRLGPR
jgi:hypothetical protein